MEMSEIHNGSQWTHDIFLMNKAGVTEYITGLSSTLIMESLRCKIKNINIVSVAEVISQKEKRKKNLHRLANCL